MSEQTESGCHLTYETSMDMGVLANHELIVYQGPYADLVAMAKSIKPGMRVEQEEEPDAGGGGSGLDIDGGDGPSIPGGGTLTGGGDSGDGGDSGGGGGTASTTAVKTSLPQGGSDTEDVAYGYVRVSNVKCKRDKGGGGTMSVLLSQNVHACIIAVDFCEVSKSVLTWHAGRQGGPDLGKIAEWRAQESSDPAKYGALKVGNTDLSGETKTLAQMIRDGVENYPLYFPMVTCTATLDECPDLSLYPLNAIGDPSTPNGWTDTRGRTMDDVVGSLGQDYQWIRTVARATPNQDGTYQFVQAWQSADTINAALYDQEASE